MNRIVEHRELRHRRQQRRRSMLAGMGLLLAVLMVWQQVRAGSIAPQRTDLPMAGPVTEPASRMGCKPAQDNRDNRAAAPVNNRKVPTLYVATAGAGTP